VVMMLPVRIFTPASATAGPMAGAKCRGGFTAYAWDRLMLGPLGAAGSGNGRCVEERMEGTSLNRSFLLCVGIRYRWGGERRGDFSLSGGRMN
jgi:hypothetical protein